MRRLVVGVAVGALLMSNIHASWLIPPIGPNFSPIRLTQNITFGTYINMAYVEQLKTGAQHLLKLQALIREVNQMRTLELNLGAALGIDFNLDATMSILNDLNGRNRPKEMWRESPLGVTFQSNTFEDVDRAITAVFEKEDGNRETPQAIEQHAERTGLVATGKAQDTLIALHRYDKKLGVIQDKATKAATQQTNQGRNIQIGTDLQVDKLEIVRSNTTKAMHEGEANLMYKRALLEQMKVESDYNRRAYLIEHLQND